MKRYGFTLIEALLSCVILAVGAVVISGLTQRCMQNNVRGWEYEQAYRLLDETLDKVLVMGIPAHADMGVVRGDFGERYAHYSYELRYEPTDDKDLYRVTGTVRWNAGSQTYQVQAVTLIYRWE
ncbi:MAG: prepilin-type N-terminal cleavage/methylation domain-containing protein [Sedimentisphaerales bacterium]|nr:prepilin-type N-terminal cleavage/methylation domain-containing protein [Sedimentisphaerales bacterium]